MSATEAPPVAADPYALGVLVPRSDAVAAALALRPRSARWLVFSPLQPLGPGVTFKRLAVLPGWLDEDGPLFDWFDKVVRPRLCVTGDIVYLTDTDDLVTLD